MNMKYVSKYASPLGELWITADEKGLTEVGFHGQMDEVFLSPDANRDEDKQKSLPANIDAPISREDNETIRKTREWLDCYFAGGVPKMEIPLHFEGTAFQQKVWKSLCEIPYGKTVSYGEVAKKIGCKSARAVGGAVGRNPIGIIVPCHRVIGADGTLTGYAAGLNRKEFLLKLEGIARTTGAMKRRFNS